MSALIGIEDLNEYTGNYGEASYKTMLIGAASQVVEDYLHYGVASSERTYRCTSWGTTEVLLTVPNVTGIASVTVGGEALNEGDYGLEAHGIYGRVRFASKVLRGQEVVIVYTAGWPPQEVPAPIKLATLRIAALMLEEANGNIGVTGKSFADMSKTFVSYTNYNKYLQPLANYRAGGL